MTEVAQLGSLLEDGQNKIFFVKYEDALEKLRAADAALPCLAEPVGRLPLSQLFLYRGVAEFFLQRQAEARASFEQALIIDRKTQWDERFGDVPRPLFLAAKEAVIEAPRGKIRVPIDLKPGAVVYVDGDPHESGSLIEGVTVGYHFVQSALDGRVLKGSMFEVKEDHEATVEVPSELLEAKAEFDMTRLRPVSVGAMGVGGLALLGGAGAGIASVLMKQELLDNYSSNRDDPEKDKLIARQNTMTYVADGSFVAAVILGGTGAVLFMLSVEKEDPATGLQGRLYPWARPDAVGFGIRGSF